ncbi:MAG: C4-dicarboxylate ABC transporter, partial [Rhodospirillaceae bacterium]|nr:C4-dicarboxylate ABC transporter [Rhodospirillaceae bacterium]
GRADAMKAGNKIQTLSAAEQKRWSRAVQIITDNWIKKGNEMGLDGKALMDDLVKMMKAG